MANIIISKNYKKQMENSTSSSCLQTLLPLAVYLPNGVQFCAEDKLPNLAVERLMEELRKDEDDDVAQCLVTAMENEVPNPTVVIDEDGFFQKMIQFYYGRTIYELLGLTFFAMVSVTKV